MQFMLYSMLISVLYYNMYRIHPFVKIRDFNRVNYYFSTFPVYISIGFPVVISMRVVVKSKETKFSN